MWVRVCYGEKIAGFNSPMNSNIFNDCATAASKTSPAAQTQLEFALLATITHNNWIIAMLPFIWMEILWGIQMWHQKIVFIWWHIFASLGRNELKHSHIEAHCPVASFSAAHNYPIEVSASQVPECVGKDIDLLLCYFLSLFNPMEVHNNRWLGIIRA